MRRLTSMKDQPPKPIECSWCERWANRSADLPDGSTIFACPEHWKHLAAVRWGIEPVPRKRRIRED